MNRSEAIAALRVIVDRADQEVPSVKGFKWISVRAGELARAREALRVLRETSGTRNTLVDKDA